MEAFSTPMMKQYMKIKKQYQDCLLFYRMGDFYELFLEDAHIGSRVLDITLTSRPKGKDGRIPMAGVPFHAVDAYLSKLVKAGHKVAICEQLSDPSKKGIIDRDVVRIVTPGTLMDEKALEKKENNYLICLQSDGKHIAVAAADVSTGHMHVAQCPVDDGLVTMSDVLNHLSAVECILPSHLYTDPHMIQVLRRERQLNLYVYSRWDTYAKDAARKVKKQLGVSTLEGYGISNMPLVIETLSVLIGYVSEMQKHAITHMRTLTPIQTRDTMLLDKSTLLNLEVFQTLRDADQTHSLLHCIDRTQTAGGGRLLRKWITSPLLKKDDITKRLNAVEELYTDRDLQKRIQILLSQISDIERILSRVSVGIGNPRDCVQLKESLKRALGLKSMIAACHAELIHLSGQSIGDEVDRIIEEIEQVVMDEPPIDPKSGGFIRSGIHEELDMLRERVNGSTAWIQKTEEKERARTGIGSLKIRFNQVFGYYIEVSKANLSLVPAEYMRKQTLVNGERFITPDLKKHEEIILTAQERMQKIEYDVFLSLIANITACIPALQKAAQSVARMDVLTSLAVIAIQRRYVRPDIRESGSMMITQGRHPVVECQVPSGSYVPNDVTIDSEGHALLLVTGPNMAGKSVLLRQVALIVLMSHMGSFVPADQAHISLVDRIFVRSGASDAITSGLSTFMVEMVETAQILHYMTEKSLIIMDEIGRGTSTYDGISIAWAVAEYIVTAKHPSPKTLFATHYHELQALEREYPERIKNVHMHIVEDKGELIFLYTVLPGGASHSFGVAVAKLAGVPHQVIQNAQEILHSLEQREPTDHAVGTPTQEDSLRDVIRSLDISRMTPLDALNTLATLQKDHAHHS